MLIAFYSSLPGSGKTTAARHLVDKHHFTCKPFADPMKQMVRPVLYDLGYSPEQVDAMLAGRKNDVVYRGKSLRYLLQTLGTEWGRTHMGETFWADLWESTIRPFQQKGLPVVVDDCRFPQEYEAISRLGGKVYRIERPLPEPEYRHASDRALDGFAFDDTIRNTGCIDDLKAELDRLVGGAK